MLPIHPIVYEPPLRIYPINNSISIALLTRSKHHDLIVPAKLLQTVHQMRSHHELGIYTVHITRVIFFVEADWDRNDNIRFYFIAEELLLV